MSKDSKKVVWFEGMTLDPHHFQQWDRYREAHLRARLGAVAPNGWGLVRSRIDEQRLSNGELSIAACTAVMPDGLVVDVPDTAPVPESRSVSDHLPATDETVRVLLAVPAERPDGRNVQLQGANWDRAPRFVAESTTRTDENTGGNERPVEVAHAHVEIRFADEPQQGYTTLPIAEVERTAAGYRLSDDFVPPCIYLQASRRLTTLTQQLLELIVSKRTELSEFKDETVAQRELSPSDVTSLNRLSVLNRAIPQLNQFHAQGKGHPQDLFHTLAVLAGELVTYVDDSPVGPRDLPTYDHEAPTAPFRQMEQILRTLLGEAAPSAGYQRIDLRQKRENLLETAVDPSVLEEGQLFLVTRSEHHAETTLANDLPEMVRVASPGTIDDVLQSYTQALTVNPTQRLPTGMPVDTQATYFKMEKRGPFWDSICDEEGIAVFVPSEFQEVDVELIATS